MNSSKGSALIQLGSKDLFIRFVAVAAVVVVAVVVDRPSEFTFELCRTKEEEEDVGFRDEGVSPSRGEVAAAVVAEGPSPTSSSSEYCS